MNLYQRVGDAYRTGGVDVESNENKRTMVESPVLPDVLALHRPHISSERNWRTQAGTAAQPADLGVNDHTVEITDFRRIIDLGERYRCGRKGIVMNRDPGQHTAAGNGCGFGSFVRSNDQRGKREA